MNTLPVRRIGRYEIRGQLGTGGMGEVYRAWDPDLHREVALKLLREQTAQDQSRRGRLLDEARAVGALAHPNVVAVYDVDVSQDVPFIVTELIDGRRLRDEIDSGPVPTRRLLDLAVQIAGGLSAAHARGITHRDMKPENVMITRDGRVKIVDFGLARAVVPQSTDLPTLATTVTVSTISGTPRYMSPEQARGADQLDFRSDQFSFGLTLYEMATGVHPFRRETAVETMTAIVSDEADPISKRNPKVPAPLRWVIERCLAKEPVDRYASTADLLKDLATLQSRLSEVSGDAVQPLAVRGSRVSRLALPAAATLALITGGALVMPGATPVSPVFKPLVTETAFQSAPVWPADEVTIAYTAEVEGMLQIFTRRSKPGEASTQLTKDYFDSYDPFWSPNGRRVFYHSKAKTSESLWSVSPAGGDAELVIENASRTAISRDGQWLVFFREAEEGVRRQPPFGLARSLFVASLDGGDAGDIHRYQGPPFDKRTFIEGFFRFSPDGSKLLAWLWGWPDEESDKPVPAHEFWMIPWPENSGTPKRILSALNRQTPAPVSFDWFPDSRHVVVALWEDAGMISQHLWLVDTVTEEARPITAGSLSETRPVVSSDSRRIAFASEQVDFDLVALPLDGSAPWKYLATARNESDPTFADEGRQLAFLSDQDGTIQIESRRQDGSRRQLLPPDAFKDKTLALGGLSLSPDGNSIAYQRFGSETGYRVMATTSAWTLSSAEGAVYQGGPAWSPTGDRFAFLERRKNTEKDLGSLVVAGVVADVPPKVVDTSAWEVSSQVKWSPDGQWLLCHSAEEGLVILKPDESNKNKKVISTEKWIAYEWAADSARVYGLRESDSRLGHYMLAEVNIQNGAERTINSDLGPVPPTIQPIRGLARGPKGILVTSVANVRSQILYVDNFSLPRSWFERLRRWR